MENFNYFAKDGRGKDVLFLHGWKHDRHTWDAVVPLCQTEFRCWTLDLPGFGENPRPKRTWTIKEYAKWTAAFITKHHLKNPIIVGHSFGGRVAVVLAATYPDLVSSVVLYATPGVHQPLPVFHNMASALYRGLKKAHFSLDKLLVTRKLRDKLRSSDYKHADELKDIFIATINFHLEPYLAKITAPTLLLWGGNDTVIPPKIGEAMSVIISDSKLVIAPNETHYFHLENPRLFSGLIKKFIHE